MQLTLPADECDAMQISNLFSVKNQIIVVTGGASGIGLMITTAFLVNGAQCVYISSRSEATCKTVSEELCHKYGTGRVVAFPHDLSQISEIEHFVKEVTVLTKKIDVLVNNSGTTWGEPFEEFQEKGWDKVMDLNVKSVFFTTKAFLPLLCSKEHDVSPIGTTNNLPSSARVIVIASSAGIRPQLTPTYSYDVSKAAVIYLCRKLASEFGARNVTINAVCPGVVPSRMSKQLTTYASFDDMSSTFPIARVGNSSDMAAAVLYLASNAGAWITGQTIVVDGGASAAL